MINLRTILFGKRGQNTAEYAILIGLVIAGVVAMQTFVKRGVEKKIQLRTDAFSTTQYEPYYLDSNVDTTAHSQIKLTDRGSLGSRRDYEDASYTERNVSQTQASPNQ